MISFMRIVTCIIFFMFSTSLFATEEMDGMGDWSCKEWLKLNETLENESGIINMQDMTIQWFLGYVSAINVVASIEHGEYLELSKLFKNKDALFAELIIFCEINQDKLVAEFIVDKMSDLVRGIISGDA